MTTIIFIRDKNSNDQEVSGYIDYAQRLRTEDFNPYFEKRWVSLSLSVHTALDAFFSTVLVLYPLLSIKTYIALPALMLYALFNLYTRKRLLPKPTDLSYYNWETQLSTSNSSPYYQVIADSAQGLLFKNKRDRKLINVNPDVSPGDNTTRTELETEDYVQVVFYDHTTRRRL